MEKGLGNMVVAVDNSGGEGGVMHNDAMIGDG